MNAPHESQFEVSAELDQQTLAAGLRHWLPGQSWKQVRMLISGRRVLVNGSMCLDDARRLQIGESVECLDRPQPALPRPRDLQVLFADEHVAVVNKPPGLLTVRHRKEQHWPERRKQRQPTLDELFAERLQLDERPYGRRSQERAAPLHVVHRLDRDTSGPMVFARTELAAEALIDQFRQHTAQRSYRAIVWGHPTDQTVRNYLVRDRGDGLRGGGAKSPQAKLAVTHLRHLESFGNYSLMACQLETGRTHQIRIHLAELGHPVCGDRLYRGPMDQPPIPDDSGATRQALHSVELGFHHPESGEWLAFEVPRPRDFETLLNQLRTRATNAHSTASGKVDSSDEDNGTADSDASDALG